MSDKTWSLGPRPIYVSITEFNGALKCHIRYQDQVNGQTVHKKKGITLNLEEWDTLSYHWSEINHELQRLRTIRQQQPASLPGPTAEASLCGTASDRISQNL